MFRKLLSILTIIMLGMLISNTVNTPKISSSRHFDGVYTSTDSFWGDMFLIIDGNKYTYINTSGWGPDKSRGILYKDLKDDDVYYFDESREGFCIEIMNEKVVRVLPCLGCNWADLYKIANRIR